ncbi:MAG: cadherin domain-containing protein, partial [Gammaproteobacteria bacterium]
ATAYAQTLNLDGYSGYLAVISSDAESQFVYDNILVPNQYRSPDSSGYGPADFYYFGLTRIDGEWLFEHPDGLQPVSDALTDPWATTNFISDANRTVAAITGDSYIPGSWEDVYRSRGEWIAFGTTGAFYSIVEFEPNGVGFEPQVISFDLNEPGSYFYSVPMNNGGVIAVWENSPVHDGDIVYQRFNIDGTPSDNKVVVADDLHTHVPAIAELRDGSVVVTYVSYDYSVGRYQAAYKIFDDQDLLVTEGLLSNTLDDYNGIRPVALESGDFFISYRVSDNFPQTSGYAQGFQFFDSAGVPDGNEIIIPQPLGGGREAPVVHSDNTLAFLWASSNDLRLNIYELSTLREGSIDDALIADQVVYSQSDQLGNYELLKSGDGYYVTFGDSGTFYIAEYASDGSLLQAGSPIVDGLSSAAHMQVVDLGLTGQLMVLYSWQPDSTVYETYAKIVSTDGFTDLSGPQKVAPGQLNTDADLFFESGTVFFSTHDGVTTSTHGILFNVAPEFDQTSYLTSVDENITTGSFTLTTNVLDPENDPLVYSLSGPDNGYFAVDPDTGVISLTVSPDYESKSSYDLVIEVSDGFSVATAPISVEVIDGNDEPEGSVAIVGDPVVGEYVTLDMSGLTDDDGGIAQVLSYHWYRDGQPLDNKQLQVLEEDVGSSLSVEITYIDGRGFTNTVMSSPTTSVLDLNDPPEFVSQV